MAIRQRIAVIGAGIIGSAVAFALARRGATVTVLDGRSHPGAATQASAGILAPYVEAHDGGPLFDLTVQGLTEYDEFVADLRSVASATFEYQRCGTLEIARDESRAAELRRRLDQPWAARAGLQWLDGAALMAEVPAVSPDAVGGLLCSVHGYVAVEAFGRALRDAADRLGTAFVDEDVASIQLPADGVLVGSTAGRSFRVDRVVLCAGAWSPPLDPMGGLHGRITPVRGQLLRLSSAIRLSRVLWDRSCYLVPWDDGTVLVGATVEDVGFDARATVEGVRHLLSSAEDVVPGLSAATFQGVSVGLRPACTGGLPVVGPGPDARVLYAAGHYRNGVLLAPLTARLIADQVFGSAVTSGPAGA